MLGADPAYTGAILRSHEPPQLRSDPPAPGRVWKSRVREDLTAFPTMVADGDVGALENDRAYARVEMSLRTQDAPTDGGISLVAFVAAGDVVLIYRVPGG